MGSSQGTREASLRAPASPARTSPSRAPQHRGPLAAPSPSPSPASPPPLSPGCARLCVRPGPGSGTKPGRLRPPSADKGAGTGGDAQPGSGPVGRGRRRRRPRLRCQPAMLGDPRRRPLLADPRRRGAALPRDTSRRCRAGKGGRRGASRSDLCRVPQPRRHPARTARAPRSPLLQRRHLASFCSLASAAGPPHQYARGALTSAPAPRTAPRARLGSPRPPQPGAGAPSEPSPSAAPSPLPTARGFFSRLLTLFRPFGDSHPRPPDTPPPRLFCFRRWVRGTRRGGGDRPPAPAPAAPSWDTPRPASLPPAGAGGAFPRPREPWGCS